MQKIAKQTLFSLSSLVKYPANTMGSISHLPAYGHRLLPVVIDEIARDGPDRVLFYTPRNGQPSQGYDEVNTKIFANSINRLCGWLDSQLGSPAGPRTIAYIGQSKLTLLFYCRQLLMGIR
jgi:hypothetical protein